MPLLRSIEEVSKSSEEAICLPDCGCVKIFSELVFNVW